jgi:hypothetical protein
LLIASLTGEATGGSSVTSYVVYWDQGLGGDLVPLIGSSVNQLNTEFIFVNGISSGVNYVFTYAAKNIQGTGEQSNPVTVIAATVPAQMNTPVVTYETDLLYKVSFSQPSSGGAGVSIESYEI